MPVIGKLEVENHDRFIGYFDLTIDELPEKFEGKFSTNSKKKPIYSHGKKIGHITFHHVRDTCYNFIKIFIKLKNETPQIYRAIPIKKGQNYSSSYLIML